MIPVSEFIHDVIQVYEGNGEKPRWLVREEKAVIEALEKERREKEYWVWRLGCLLLYIGEKRRTDLCVVLDLIMLKQVLMARPHLANYQRKAVFANDDDPLQRKPNA